MNWWQALVTILLGNTIVLVPILLNSHPGTKYGIPFPVFARAAYGTLGSNLPALMRALVACGWFGIQAWIGGEALHTFFASARSRAGRRCSAPGFGGHTTTEWLSFLLFWGLNIFIIYRGMDLLRVVENWAAPFVLVMTAVLAGAGRSTRRTASGPLLAQPGKFRTLGEFLPVFVPSLTGDDRLLGDALAQHAGLHPLRPQPARAGDRPGRGAADDDVRLRRHGRPHHERHRRSSTARRSGTRSSSSASFTLARRRRDLDVHGGRRDARRQHRRQRRLARERLRERLPAAASRFKTGGLITGILGILMQPWRLLADPSGYIFTWLLGYSGGLGSIAGVLIADYWIVRARRARARGPLPRRRRLPLPRRLEPRGGRRDARRLRARLGRPRRSRRCGRSTTTPGSSASASAFAALRRAHAHGSPAYRSLPNRPEVPE